MRGLTKGELLLTLFLMIPHTICICIVGGIVDDAELLLRGDPLKVGFFGWRNEMI